jgi:hypothetical protein
MDVKTFQDARKSDLENFQKQYKVLKDEYAKALAAAIEEPDVAKRQDYVTRVLQANATMVEEIRTMVAAMNRGKDGFDQKDLTSLENDLIEYQKEYAEIEQSKDKVNTLKQIRDTTKQGLGTVTSTYYLLIGAFIFMCLIVVYLVAKTSWTSSYTTSSPTSVAPRTPRATY